MAQKTLICGFGNKLKTDDGFGPSMIELLAKEPLPDNVTLKDFGISGFQAALEIGDYDKVIIIDAIRAGKEPGTLCRVVLHKSDVIHGLPLSSFNISLHESELERVLATAALIGEYPREVIVLGCEPGDLSLGLTLSEAVAQARFEIRGMIISEIMPL